MSNKAVVIYVGPKLASNHTIWCLEPIHGIPVLVHLFRRLIKGLPAGEFEFIVACHEGFMSERLRGALQGTQVEVLASKALSGVGVISDLAIARPHLKTALMFPEESILPDCRLTQMMLQRHREIRADATTVPEYPPGLVPDIYELAAISRLDGLSLPDELGANFIAVMQKANEIFEEGNEMRFKLCGLDPSFFSKGPLLAALPSKLWVKDMWTCRAAAHALEKMEAKSAFDSQEAIFFKEKLLQLEAGSSFDIGFSIAPQDGRIPILFSTKFGGFTGGQECFYDLIANLDRGKFRPLAVLPANGVLAEKLRSAGVEVEMALFDMDVLAPWKIRYFPHVIDRWGVKVVHIDGEPSAALVLAAMNLRVPYVYHLRQFLGRHAPDLMKFAAKIITGSQAVAKDILRSDIDPTNVVQIYESIRVAAFQPEQYDKAALRQANGVPGDQKIIAAIARISVEKRLDVLFRALPIVIRRFPDARVLVVGESFPKEAHWFRHLQEMVEELARALTFSLLAGREKNVRPIIEVSFSKYVLLIRSQNTTPFKLEEEDVLQGVARDNEGNAYAIVHPQTLREIEKTFPDGLITGMPFRFIADDDPRLTSDLIVGRLDRYVTVTVVSPDDDEPQTIEILNSKPLPLRSLLFDAGLNESVRVVDEEGQNVSLEAPITAGRRLEVHPLTITLQFPAGYSRKVIVPGPLTLHKLLLSGGLNEWETKAYESVESNSLIQPGVTVMLQLRDETHQKQNVTLEKNA